MFVCNIFHIYETCIQLWKKYIHKTFMAQVWSERQPMFGSIVWPNFFPLIFEPIIQTSLSCDLSPRSCYTTGDLFSRLLVFLWVFPPCLVPTLSVSSADFICTFSLKWNKALLSPHQARLNTDWLLLWSLDVCLHSLSLPGQHICFLKL